MTRSVWAFPLLLLPLIACERGAAPEAAPKAVKPAAVAAAAAVPTKLAPSPLKAELPADAPSAGESTAKVTLVVFSDFECPFCARVVPTLKELQKTYGADLRVVFRQQPLPMHANAKLAAEASLAANEQGKFWEFHDRMFANQQALDRASLEKSAQELGLDVARFKAALDTGKFRARVEQDAAAGSDAGANGTPTFFINGRKLVGAQPVTSFKAVIAEELTRADKLLASGVSREALYAKLLSEVPTAVEPPTPAEKVDNLDIAGAPVRGPANAKVTVVVFSDFQCPFCSRAVPTLKALEEQYPGKIRFAFKNQPLPFHDKARLAGAAALAANEQGKFWEFHDLLFAHQDQLDRPALEKHAQSLGLDLKRFKTALDTNRFDAALTADSNEAARVGANGTPTFFVNGRRIVGAQPVEAFKTIIDDELAKANK